MIIANIDSILTFVKYLCYIANSVIVHDAVFSLPLPRGVYLRSKEVHKFND